MLKWLKGDKVDHPLASARDVQRVVEGFPARDPLKTLEDATYWLGSVTESDGFKVDHRFGVIDGLDAATRKAQVRVRQTYAALPVHEHVQEKRVWKVATDFWDGLAAAYLLCVAQAHDAGSVPSNFKSRVPLLAAKATHALRYQMHWALVRYGVLRQGFWADIAKCARFAESGDGADTLFELYADGGGASSQRREFLRCMMFWAASPSGLSPAEQDIAERLVVHLSARYRFDVKPWEGCDYCFDLDASRPPLRCLPGAPTTAATRYFDSGQAWQDVQSLLAELGATGAVPKGVDWGGVVDAPAIDRVLKHVRLNWAKTMPPRASVRRKTAMRLLVMHGYQSVLGAIEPGVSEGLDFSDTLSHDSWIAEDASAGGYGVVVPAGKGEWLRVGVLVALRTETESSWDLGIIRRVKSDELRQHRIGLQLISKSAVPVYLRKPGAAAQGGKPQTAILLGTRPSRSGSLHIVTRRDLMDAREPLEAVYSNPPVTISLGQGNVLESGHDFDWLRYKFLDTIL